MISLNSCAGKTTAFAGKLKSATCIFGLRLGLIVNQRSRNQQRRVTDDACKEASTRLFQRFTTLTNRVEEKNNGSLRPDELLPVDVFLDEMVRRVNAPKIVFTPTRLKNKVWTENFHAYVYAQIEQAFWKAGQLRGGNRSGYIEKLKELRSWVVEQEKDPSQNHNKFFVQKTAFLFKKGILEDRRQERIGVLIDIDRRASTYLHDLARLKSWIDDDLADCRLLKKGRPSQYQKIIFAAAMANLWFDLTGKPITKGPKTNFARFVVACWHSGFEGLDVNSDFRRAIRHHIAESEEPCGRCDGCNGSEPCRRKRYFGILL